MSGIKAVHRFLSRLIVGSGLAIWLGMKADESVEYVAIIADPISFICFLRELISACKGVILWKIK